MKDHHPEKANYSIALVNYKSLELTKKCLQLLQDVVQEKSISVYVVDNDSRDSSSEYLRTLSWINLIERNQSILRLEILLMAELLISL